MVAPRLQQQENQGDWVVAIGPDGEPIVTSQRLADLEGYQVIQAGFGSQEEAQSAVRAPSPVDQETSRINQEQTALFDYNQTYGQQGPQPAQEGSDVMARLAAMAWPEGQAASPITGSPEEMMFNYGDVPQMGESSGVPRRIDSAASRAPAVPTNPVDPNLLDPREIFGGDTWAAGADVNQDVINNLLSGQMTTGAAVNNITEAAGVPTYGNRDFLEQQYEDFRLLNMMANPGENIPDPTEYYGQAGDHVTHFLQPSNGVRDINGDALWNNSFSNAYTQQVVGMAEGEDDPAAFERDMVMSNTAALAPYIGNENAAWINNRVERLYDEYIASGINAQIPFTEFLRMNGAEDWI